jgi:hypothetical protein
MIVAVINAIPGYLIVSDPISDPFLGYEPVPVNYPSIADD